MFTIRTKLPNKGNKFYNTTSSGGYSHCIKGYPTISGLNVLCNCFAGETKYITSEGLKTFYDTVGTIQNVLNENGEYVPAEIKTFGVQQLYEMEFSNGYKVYVTGNHRWVVDNLSKYQNKIYSKRKIKTTLELTKSDNIPYNYYNGNDLLDKDGILHGLVYGDGYRKKYCNTYELRLFGNKQELKKYVPKHIKSDYNLKEIPSIYEREEYLRGFIAGLIATDGTITNDTFKISSVKLEDLEQIKNICYKIGIAVNNIYEETRDIKIKNYEYLDHTIYYLTFKRRNIEKLLLKNTDINKITKEQKEIKYTHLKSIKLTDRKEEVFCAVEPKTHTITLENNILTGQCVGWACGRFNEVYSELTGYQGMKYWQLNCNAEDFIKRGKTLGLKVSTIPVVGGIMVWEGKGSAAGHVAFVEMKNSDSQVYTSESGYGNFAFANYTRNKGNGNWGLGSSYKYLGCLINPAVKENYIQYQSYDNKLKTWLPKVKSQTNEYAGNMGNAMGGIRIYGGYKYRAHLKGGSWLAWVNKADNTDNGYAGIYGKDIDGVQIYNATYRVHLKGQGWLPWVSKVDNTDNGYAGIYGKVIDAIQIK